MDCILAPIGTIAARIGLELGEAMTAAEEGFGPVELEAMRGRRPIDLHAANGITGELAVHLVAGVPTGRMIMLAAPCGRLLWWRGCRHGEASGP
jgi:hypothetical protein